MLSVSYFCSERIITLGNTSGIPPTQEIDCVQYIMKLVVYNSLSSLSLNRFLPQPADSYRSTPMFIPQPCRKFVQKFSDTSIVLQIKTCITGTKYCTMYFSNYFSVSNIAISNGAQEIVVLTTMTRVQDKIVHRKVNYVMLKMTRNSKNINGL